MPVISRGKPAFASSGNASGANDSSYSTYWRSSGAMPAWLAYDLSSVPAANRGQVVVGWYNDPVTTPYDHTVVGDAAYNNLGSYTIQVNPAAGGGQPPGSGWVTLATVANTAAWLTGIVPESWGDAASAWGIAMLSVVAVIGLGIAWASGWRVAPGIALAWGLSWLAVGRLTGAPPNQAIGIAAIVVAVIVLIVPLAVAGLRLLRPEQD